MTCTRRCLTGRLSRMIRKATHRRVKQRRLHLVLSLASGVWVQAATSKASRATPAWGRHRRQQLQPLPGGYQRGSPPALQQRRAHQPCALRVVRCLPQTDQAAGQRSFRRREPMRKAATKALPPSAGHAPGQQQLLWRGPLLQCLTSAACCDGLSRLCVLAQCPNARINEIAKGGGGEGRPSQLFVIATPLAPAPSPLSTRLPFPVS